ncbi:hypothetical protein Q3G72_000296 [Acer saccharum]|nr:hypothetical protein Q3G72_000296 [Acer saccharum]
MKTSRRQGNGETPYTHLRPYISLSFANLLGQKSLVNIGQNASVGDCNGSQKLAQLLIASVGDCNESQTPLAARYLRTAER